MQEKIQVINKDITADSLKVVFYIELLKKSFPATLLLDEVANTKKDYAQLLDKSKQTLETLFYTNEMARITNEVAIEITESAYEGELKMQEYADLKEDLAINEFHFYEEDLLLIFLSPKIFLKNAITVQTDYSLAIEDLSIDM